MSKVLGTRAKRNHFKRRKTDEKLSLFEIATFPKTLPGLFLRDLNFGRPALAAPSGRDTRPKKLPQRDLIHNSYAQRDSDECINNLTGLVIT